MTVEVKKALSYEDASISELLFFFFFFFQAEEGIRDVERSRGLGDGYKRKTGNRVHRWA